MREMESPARYKKTVQKQAGEIKAGDKKTEKGKN